MIRRYSGLLAVTLVGLILRLVNIHDWPLWSDEALTLLIAQWPLQTLFLIPADPTPGLYYALHKALLGPFAQVATARSISVVAGTLLIPASYFLAKQARVPAVLTAALVALSFPLIDYSQEARAYSLLVLLVTLSAGSFLWWARTERLGLLVASLGFRAGGLLHPFLCDLLGQGRWQWQRSGQEKGGRYRRCWRWPSSPCRSSRDWRNITNRDFPRCSRPARRKQRIRSPARCCPFVYRVVWLSRLRFFSAGECGCIETRWPAGSKRTGRLR